MYRAAICFACLFLSLQSNSTAFAQDGTHNTVSPKGSIADRLKAAKHICLSIEEKLGGYSVHLYTEDRHQRNVEALATYNQQHNEWKTKVASFDEQRRAAHKRGASSEELVAITEAQNSLPHPTYPLSGQPYEVVFVGTDYIEVETAEFPGSTTLIPFAKICKVTAGELPEPRR